MIEAALIAGQPQLSIVDRFDVSQSALSRHQAKHMKKIKAYLEDHGWKPIELTGDPESDITLLCEVAGKILDEARRNASTDLQIKALDAAGRLIEKAARIFGNIPDQTVEVKLLNVIVPDEHYLESGSSGVLEGAREIEAPGRR